MVHIFFLFGRQKERSKEKLSAAPASTTAVREVGTVLPEPANAEF